jgi:hypothetical protein
VRLAACAAYSAAGSSAPLNPLTLPHPTPPTLMLARHTTCRGCLCCCSTADRRAPSAMKPLLPGSAQPPAVCAAVPYGPCRHRPNSSLQTLPADALCSQLQLCQLPQRHALSALCCSLHALLAKV